MASGPNSAGHRAQACGDGVQRLVPGDALEAAFALGADAPLRIQQPVGVILALQVLRHFAAQKAARHRMLRIAAQLGGAAVFDVDQQGAAVRTIQRAHGVTDFGHFPDYILPDGVEPPSSMSPARRMSVAARVRAASGNRSTRTRNLPLSLPVSHTVKLR